MTIEEYLRGRDAKTGESWLQFCWKRGFSVDEMTSGFEWQKRIEARKEQKPEVA